VVQIFATDSFSASETSQIVVPLLRWLFPDADASWIASAHFAIRKLSHFVVYAILAIGVPLGYVSLISAVLIGDMGVSLAVTANALRLGRVDR